MKIFLKTAFHVLNSATLVVRSPTVKSIGPDMLHRKKKDKYEARLREGKSSKLTKLRQNAHVDHAADDEYQTNQSPNLPRKF